MRISIITATYNSATTIKSCIKSVNDQTCKNIEHIIIDGGSSDKTIEIVNSMPNRVSKLVSEKDNGIYDAMNKGIKYATGDVIGILNSDDFFYDCYVVEKIADTFKSTKTDSVYGDIQFVDRLNPNKVVRYYSSSRFTLAKFKYGYMPAHPSFYVRRQFFDRFGYYSENYKIAADFELLLRFLYVKKISSVYIKMPFVSMRRGGVSTKSLKSNILLNKEIIKAFRDNDLRTNYLFVYSKYFKKIFEFV